MAVKKDGKPAKKGPPGGGKGGARVPAKKGAPVKRGSASSREEEMSAPVLADALPAGYPAGPDRPYDDRTATSAAPGDGGEKDMGSYVRGAMGHLDEFRSRIILPVIVVLVLTVAGFFLSDHLLAFISRPYLALGFTLNVFNLIESFMLRVKVALIAALLAGVLVIIVQLWRFVLPRVDRRDRMFVRLSFLAALLLFYGGVAVTYVFLLPMAIKFLITLTPEHMANTISAGKYLSFVTMFCFGLGAVCELPIVVLVLTKMGMVTPAFLSSKRKIAIVLIWVLAAIITPTVDPFTQAAVAVPLMLLYEISIMLSRLVIVRKKKREQEDEAAYA